MVFFLFLRRGKSNPRADDRADHGPEPRHDRPGRAANERARNCAVLIGPSFGPVPQANCLCLVVHVASLIEKAAGMLAHPPHRRDIKDWLNCVPSAMRARCLRCRVLSMVTTNAGQLNFRFAALAKARIELISRLICASKAAGVIGIRSMPCCASFSRTPGAANAVCVSWASLSTISRGGLAGTNRAVQNV